MDSYEIIQNYSIFSSGEDSVPPDDSIRFYKGTHKDNINFKVKWNSHKHQQNMKIYLEPGKYISIHKTQGIKSIENSIMKYFIIGMKRLFDKGLQDSIPLWEELKLSSILKFFLKKTRIYSSINIENYIETIRLLEKFSTETYEGKKICMAIGFDAKLTTDSIDTEIHKIGNKFLKVLTNGINTLFVCDGQTRFSDIKYIENSTQEDLDSSQYPLVFSKIAHWTSDPNRFACVLTQQGEILLFKNKELIFIKRRGDWKFLSPTSLLHKVVLHNPLPEYKIDKDILNAVRSSVMATCLDVSFSRTGACIGIIADPEDKADFILPKDRLENQPILKKIVSGKKFQEIDRAIRKELAGLDGAIVIDRDGTIRAIGAILKNDECSERDGQGARSIAAQVLAAHGYGFMEAISASARSPFPAEGSRTRSFLQSGSPSMASILSATGAGVG